MFTGLVEALGQITQARREGPGCRLVIQWPGLAEPLAIGESIAVNGCCLTVIARGDDWFEVQLGPETLARTNLGARRPGDRVNLERALRPTDRMGGHFVQGHVDATATLITRRTEGEWQFLRFAFDPAWAELLVAKGSIAVDGVSLTVVDDLPDGFSVMLIPHTLAVTTLGLIQPGDQVNIEFDLLAKHVRKLLQAQRGGD
jgi:riboflavin synthase